MMTDPISDMLTRLRNAIVVRKSEILVPHSRIKFAIAKILEKEGFVASVRAETDAKRPMIRIGLKYDDDMPAIHSLRRISTPGRRVYRKSTELPRVLSNLGIAIVSTPNGLMTNKEAKVRHLGGEVICEIS
jgi:small subunit ribosomal protein S8